jgi:hypothetical protein
LIFFYFAPLIHLSFRPPFFPFFILFFTFTPSPRSSFEAQGSTYSSILLFSFIHFSLSLFLSSVPPLLSDDNDNNDRRCSRIIRRHTGQHPQAPPAFTQSARGTEPTPPQEEGEEDQRIIGEKARGRGYLDIHGVLLTWRQEQVSRGQGLEPPVPGGALAAIISSQWVRTASYPPRQITMAQPLEAMVLGRPILLEGGPSRKSLDKHSKCVSMLCHTYMRTPELTNETNKKDAYDENLTLPSTTKTNVYTSTPTCLVHMRWMVETQRTRWIGRCRRQGTSMWTINHERIDQLLPHFFRSMSLKHYLRGDKIVVMQPAKSW